MKIRTRKGQYILLSVHREENIDNEDNFMTLMNAVNDMAKTYGLPIIYSTHPRSQKFIDQRDLHSIKMLEISNLLDSRITIHFSRMLCAWYLIVEQ